MKDKLVQHTFLRVIEPTNTEVPCTRVACVFTPCWSVAITRTRLTRTTLYNLNFIRVANQVEFIPTKTWITRPNSPESWKLLQQENYKYNQFRNIYFLLESHLSVYYLAGSRLRNKHSSLHIKALLIFTSCTYMSTYP